MQCHWLFCPVFYHTTRFSSRSNNPNPNVFFAQVLPTADIRWSCDQDVLFENKFEILWHPLTNGVRLQQRLRILRQNRTDLLRSRVVRYPHLPTQAANVWEFDERKPTVLWAPKGEQPTKNILILHNFTILYNILQISHFWRVFHLQQFDMNFYSQPNSRW